MAIGTQFLSKNSNEVRLEVPVPDFIPYACHYDKDTLLTKNGELLQTIKIIGFTYEAVGSEEINLRKIIRRAIKENIKSTNFAVWFHTVRRKKNLEPKGEYNDSFSKSLHEGWVKHHQWDQQYVNELFVSIIYTGQSLKIKTPQDFLRSLSPKRVRKSHEKFLEDAYKELKEVVDKMLEQLENYGAHRLTVVERNGTMYSEQIEFLSRLINLRPQEYPVPMMDIAKYIATHKVAFGFNALEVSGEGGKQFAALLTIKEYTEVSADAVDKFLQLPYEFFVTQSLNFINNKKALAHFKNQHYILQVSKDQNLANEMGINAIMESDTGSPTDFGGNQLTIMLVAPTLKELDKELVEATNALSSLGIVATRRDLRMEQCFWSQLPANFSFLSRNTPIPVAHIGGFASLYNFPAGRAEDNLWGPAVTLFRTIANTPYFFSFHHQNRGHSSIIGPYGSGKTALLNFLLAESRKFNGRLFFFDQQRGSKVFLTAMGGSYRIVTDIPMNPLLLDDTKENRRFLYEWFELLVSREDIEISEQERDYITQLVEKIFSLPKEKRRLSTIASAFGEATPGSFAERIAPWHGKGSSADLFDNDKDELNLNNHIFGFGMSPVVERPECQGQVLFYMLHCIESTLDGTPTMIVLDEAWNLVNNPVFAPKLGQWLDRMEEKNAVVIFATESVDDTRKSEVTETITNRIATQIFLPNTKAKESRHAYRENWGLSEAEFDMLLEMETRRRQFLLRQGGDAVVAELNLATLPNELSVLSGSDETVTIMEEAIAESSDTPEHWLPIFYDKVKENAKKKKD